MMPVKILTIIIAAIGLNQVAHANEENMINCSFTINFEKGEPSTYFLQGDSTVAYGTLGTLQRTDLDGEVISQKGIILDRQACLYDITEKTYLNADSHDTILDEMTIPTFYKDNICDGKIRSSFQEGKSVAILIQDVWHGYTQHYARDFALIVDDINVDNEWVCEK